MNEEINSLEKHKVLSDEEIHFLYDAITRYGEEKRTVRKGEYTGDQVSCAHFLIEDNVKFEYRYHTHFIINKYKYFTIDLNIDRIFLC